MGELQTVICELIAKASSSSVSWEQGAAQMTGALPVYGDIGGMLLITPDLRVLEYDPDSRECKQVDDPHWRTVAFAAASERYGELAELRPQRPVAARSCNSCDGTGRILANARCGHCAGLGWSE